MTRKNPHAVALGRRGGLKSLAGRLRNLTPEQRSAIARHAAKALWAQRRAAESASKFSA